MDEHAVLGLEAHGSRRDERRRREVGRQPLLAQHARRSARGGPHGRQRRPLGPRREVCDPLAVAGHDRRPLEAGAGRQHLGRGLVRRHAHHVAAVQVVGCRAGVAREHERAPIGAERDVLGHEIARRQQQRLAAGRRQRRRQRIEVRPAVLVGQEDDAAAARPSAGWPRRAWWGTSRAASAARSRAACRRPSRHPPSRATTAGAAARGRAAQRRPHPDAARRRGACRRARSAGSSRATCWARSSGSASLRPGRRRRARARRASTRRRSASRRAPTRRRRSRRAP